MAQLSETDCWSNIDFDVCFKEDVPSEGSLGDADIFGDSLEEVVAVTDFFPTELSTASTETKSLKRKATTVEEPSPSQCPCCKISLTSNSMHMHVKSCFLESQKEAAPPANTLSLIDSIRGSVGKMDLRKRINLMESLNRLATMSSKKSRQQHQNTLSAQGQKSDNHVLSLLYSSAAVPKDSVAEPDVPKASPHVELVTPTNKIVHFPKFADSFLSEATTPPMNPLLDPSYQTFTPLSSPDRSQPTIRGLKKRKVTEMLTYSSKRLHPRLVEMSAY